MLVPILICNIRRCHCKLQVASRAIHAICRHLCQRHMFCLPSQPRKWLYVPPRPFIKCAVFVCWCCAKGGAVALLVSCGERGVPGVRRLKHAPCVRDVAPPCHGAPTHAPIAIDAPGFQAVVTWSCPLLCQNMFCFGATLLC